MQRSRNLKTALALAFGSATTAAAIVGAKADPKWAEVAERLYVPFSTSAQLHTDFDPSVPQARREGSTPALLMFPSLEYPIRCLRGSAGTIGPT